VFRVISPSGCRCHKLIHFLIGTSTSCSSHRHPCFHLARIDFYLGTASLSIPRIDLYFRRSSPVLTTGVAYCTKSGRSTVTKLSTASTLSRFQNTFRLRELATSHEDQHSCGDDEGELDNRDRCLCDSALKPHLRSHGLLLGTITTTVYH